MTLEQKLQSAHSTSENSFEKIIVNYISIWQVLLDNYRSTPEKIFYSYYPDDHKTQSYTASEFIKKTEIIASGFQWLGLKSGDRIATAGHNHPDMILTYFAAWKMGFCVVPFNMGEDDNRLQYIISHAQPKLIVGLTDELDRIKKMSVTANTLHHSELHQFPEKSLTTENVNQLQQDALLIYTSGTTGNPKGVLLTQYQLLVDADAIKKWFQISSDDRILSVLPIHHVNGTVVTHVMPVVAGASIVLGKKFHVKSFFKICREEKITVSSVVPTLLQFLSQHEFRKEEIPNSLKFLICGAGPLTVDVASRFETAFGIPVMHGYGLSETTCYSCFLPNNLTTDEHRYWLTEMGFPSIGVPIPANEMEIQNDNGETLPEGEKGEIVIRGHNVMKSYYDNQAANESAFQFGWFRSGDEGFFKFDASKRKFFFITGRFKELIIRGGINLSPLEIDEVISRCEGVKAGICVGFENDWYGEEVGALVVRSDSALTEKQVLEFCGKNLPFMKQPKVVLFTDELPITTTGKYQRNKVKHLFSQWKQTQFKME